ncbi:MULTISPECIES: DUF1304 domain-containing protein [unclassified Gemella]|uniref:DUF1304 domain-containing protein n=1 Tax=unclassified Gemella TaxID=2624949 RepID=UPI0010738BE1|nr:MULTISPECIES: DUF1304 domain-containing protein [unclassified Gemella]MBF0710453.1 DUF1304 domain-containing protein [Gemella sp. GL1.1]MBF0747353.1 DUF1304 domain-containing protein [Gemella sp. 19428wG2_WT2a]NYS27797.1 DUF1304 domain-containing protein [Gemella sp. GL1]TFU57511.1 DUF1304 domain-containing protein [Gemella sp. WT2a]
MSIITSILSTLVALEFVYIFYLETLATNSDSTARVFKMSKEELSKPSINTLFKNQGVYNLLIGLLILVALFIYPSVTWLGLLLGYVILVAIYGGLTSDKMIILKQGGLAILALLSLIFL